MPTQNWYVMKVTSSCAPTYKVQTYNLIYREGNLTNIKALDVIYGSIFETKNWNEA